MTSIQFTPDLAARFVKAYNSAKDKQMESFIFNGNEFLVSYAYYVIEYLVINKMLSGSYNDKKIFICK